jgi:hypothetical protein
MADETDPLLKTLNGFLLSADPISKSGGSAFKSPYPGIIQIATVRPQNVSIVRKLWSPLNMTQITKVSDVFFRIPSHMSILLTISTACGAVHLHK